MIRSYTVVLALALAACGSSQPPGGEPPSSPVGQPTSAATDADGDWIEGSWVLAWGTVDGASLEPVADHRVTLLIEGSELGGTVCNHYGVRATMTAAGLRLEGTGMTDMACRDEVMALESAYLGALMRVRQIERDGDELVARGDGVEMRFTGLAAPPTAELVDTTWLLDGLVSADAVAGPMGELAWVEFRSDGTFAGSTGCRSFEGVWMESGDQIITPSWGMDEGECPPALQSQDGHVVTVIGDGFMPSVEGDRLTLMELDGTGLTYRADSLGATTPRP